GDQRQRRHRALRHTAVRSAWLHRPRERAARGGGDVELVGHIPEARGTASGAGNHHIIRGIALKRRVLYSICVAGLGLAGSACTESPTSPSSASATTGTVAERQQSQQAGQTATGSSATTQGTNTANGFSLRFQGTVGGDVDRVKVPVDPQVPADVGGDF